MDENTNAGSTPVARGSSKSIYVVIAVIVLVLIGWMMMRGGNSSGVDVTINPDGSTSYGTSEGSATVGETSLPSNWPSDVPAYSGAKLQYSGSSNPATGKTGAAVVFTTKDTPVTVTAFYKEQLVANGWTITGEASANGMTTLTATKDTRTFGMYIAPSGEGTETTVTVGVEGV